VKRALVCVALAGCMPDMQDTESIAISVESCVPQRVSKYLPLGSMWIDVRPLSLYLCELTLGGETENPQYGGEASQRCVFYRDGSVSIDVPSGGPAYIEDGYCVDL
jgi:hypothetical protein